MSYTYLQERGEESSVEFFSDIPLSVLSRLNLTVEKSCCNANETECCQNFQSGMMSERLMETRGEEKLTLCAEGSHAKISVLPEKGPVSEGSAADFGQRWQELSVRLDLDAFSWRIHPYSENEVLPWSSVTLPAWGMLQDGVLWEQIIVALNTPEKEYGFLPTPLASDGSGGGVCRTKNGREYNLRDWWAIRGFGKRRQNRNPKFWEWVMGWPMDWTELKPVEMDKFQSWLQRHGIS